MKVNRGRVYYISTLEFDKWEVIESVTPTNQCILTRNDRIEEYNILSKLDKWRQHHINRLLKHEIEENKIN